MNVPQYEQTYIWHVTMVLRFCCFAVALQLFGLPNHDSIPWYPER
jgi:hypothetical protein